MHRIELAGWQGLLLFVAALLAALATLLLVPAWVLATLWNVVFDPVASVPAIHWGQGLLLWLILLLAAVVVWQPDIQIGFATADGEEPGGRQGPTGSRNPHCQQATRWPDDPDDAPIDESRYSEHWRHWRRRRHFWP